MPKWKCDICGTEFDNFQAQGFDNKIYCPLCFYKHEFNTLNKGIDELIKWYEKDIEERNKRLIFFETYKDERMQELNNQAIFDDKQFIEKLKKLKGE